MAFVAAGDWSLKSPLTGRPFSAMAASSDDLDVWGHKIHVGGAAADDSGDTDERATSLARVVGVTTMGPTSPKSYTEHHHSLAFNPQLLIGEESFAPEYQRLSSERVGEGNLSLLYALAECGSSSPATPTLGVDFVPLSHLIIMACAGSSRDASAALEEAISSSEHYTIADSSSFTAYARLADGSVLIPRPFKNVRVNVEGDVDFLSVSVNATSTALVCIDELGPDVDIRSMQLDDDTLHRIAQVCVDVVKGRIDCAEELAAVPRHHKSISLIPVVQHATGSFKANAVQPGRLEGSPRSLADFRAGTRSGSLFRGGGKLPTELHVIVDSLSESEAGAVGVPRYLGPGYHYVRRRRQAEAAAAAEAGSDDGFDLTSSDEEEGSDDAAAEAEAASDVFNDFRRAAQSLILHVGYALATDLTLVSSQLERSNLLSSTTGAYSGSALSSPISLFPLNEYVSLTRGDVFVPAYLASCGVVAASRGLGLMGEIISYNSKDDTSITMGPTSSFQEPDDVAELVRRVAGEAFNPAGVLGAVIAAGRSMEVGLEQDATVVTGIGATLSAAGRLGEDNDEVGLTPFIPAAPLSGHAAFSGLRYEQFPSLLGSPFPCTNNTFTSREPTKGGVSRIGIYDTTMMHVTSKSSAMGPATLNSDSPVSRATAVTQLSRSNIVALHRLSNKHRVLRAEMQCVSASGLGGLSVDELVEMTRAPLTALLDNVCVGPSSMEMAHLSAKIGACSMIAKLAATAATTSSVEAVSTPQALSLLHHCVNVSRNTFRVNAHSRNHFRGSRFPLYELLRHHAAQYMVDSDCVPAVSHNGPLAATYDFRCDSEELQQVVNFSWSTGYRPFSPFSPDTTDRLLARLASPPQYTVIRANKESGEGIAEDGGDEGGGSSHGGDGARSSGAALPVLPLRAVGSGVASRTRGSSSSSDGTRRSSLGGDSTHPTQGVRVVGSRASSRTRAQRCFRTQEEAEEEGVGDAEDLEKELDGRSVRQRLDASTALAAEQAQFPWHDESDTTESVPPAAADVAQASSTTVATGTASPMVPPVAIARGVQVTPDRFESWMRRNFVAEADVEMHASLLTVGYRLAFKLNVKPSLSFIRPFVAKYTGQSHTWLTSDAPGFRKSEDSTVKGMRPVESDEDEQDGDVRMHHGGSI